MSPAGRFVRGHRPDRNPLRRGSDLIETIMLVALILVTAIGAPLAAWQSGVWAHAVGHRAQLEQQAARRQVTARLVRPAPQASASAWAGSQAQARWTAPDGATVTGPVPAVPGEVAGQAVRLWVTRDGRIAGHPLQDSQVAAQAFVSGMLGAAGVVVTAAAGGALGRMALDRRRMAGWDADWRVTGPQWTART
jgi:hypothetical protein